MRRFAQYQIAKKPSKSPIPKRREEQEFELNRRKSELDNFHMKFQTTDTNKRPKLTFGVNSIYYTKPLSYLDSHDYKNSKMNVSL
jgi:hypothetical protein